MYIATFRHVSKTTEKHFSCGPMPVDIIKSISWGIVVSLKRFFEPEYPPYWEKSSQNFEISKIFRFFCEVFWIFQIYQMCFHAFPSLKTRFWVEKQSKNWKILFFQKYFGNFCWTTLMVDISLQEAGMSLVAPKALSPDWWTHTAVELSSEMWWRLCGCLAHELRWVHASADPTIFFGTCLCIREPRKKIGRCAPPGGGPSNTVSGLYNTVLDQCYEQGWWLRIQKSLCWWVGLVI